MNLLLANSSEEHTPRELEILDLKCQLYDLAEDIVNQLDGVLNHPNSLLRFSGLRTLMVAGFKTIPELVLDLMVLSSRTLECVILYSGYYRRKSVFSQSKSQP